MMTSNGHPSNRPTESRAPIKTAPEPLGPADVTPVPIMTLNPHDLEAVNVDMNRVTQAQMETVALELADLFAGGAFTSNLRSIATRNDLPFL